MSTSKIFTRFCSFVGKVEIKDLPRDWQEPVKEAITEQAEKV
jgi:hypothetical protein